MRNLINYFMSFVGASFLLLTNSTFAGSACQFAHDQVMDEYTRSIMEVCGSSRSGFEGTFAFIEAGLWPIPNNFVLRVDSSQDLTFSSMEILTGYDPTRILRGSLRVSLRKETRYAENAQLISSEAVEALGRECGFVTSLFHYKRVLPLLDQAMSIFELHVNETTIAIRDVDQRMIDAMVLAYVRLNCR